MEKDLTSRDFPSNFISNSFDIRLLEAGTTVSFSPPTIIRSIGLLLLSAVLISFSLLSEMLNWLKNNILLSHLSDLFGNS